MCTRTFTLTLELPTNIVTLHIEPEDADGYLPEEEMRHVDVEGIWEAEDKAKAESLKATNPSET